MASRTPTLRDVASRAGVHPSTVSRALNPETSQRVNAGTARRVEAAARALGYTVNPLARGLRTNRTHTIGMLIPDLTNPLFPPIVRGVEDVLAGAGYTVLLANTDNAPDREEQQFDALRSRQVDGFIVATARHQHPLTAGAIEQNVPLVLVNGLVDGLSVPAVVSDVADGVNQAVAHLRGLGHTAIAFVSGPLSMSPGSLRLRGFRQAMTEAGLPPRDELIVVCDAWSEAEGHRAGNALLAGGTPFTAVIASDDLLALGCYDALTGAGKRCPDDVSVVGFHDMPLMDKVHPPLTTVRTPHYDLGAEAANLLIGQIRGTSARAKVVTLPVSLVVRGSTGPA